MRKIWVDVPSGWRFGFPKVWEGKSSEFVDWLIAEGYPEAMARDPHLITRSWEYKEEDVQ